MSDYLNWTTYSVAAIKKAHDDDELNIRPPFQRNPVWTESQKAFLIDSILRGFPIPEIYLQELSDDVGVQTVTVIDGQQRVRACLEFIEGRFPLDPEKSVEWGDLAFEDLAPEDRKKIFNYKFVVRLLPDVPQDALRQLFARLNQNTIALNKQELRHATYWKRFIRTVEELAEDDFWRSSGIFTARDIRRMLDVEYISELVIGHLHGVQNKKLTLDKWYAHYEEHGFEEESEVRHTFTKVLGEIDSVIPDLRRTRWKKKSDFYTLFLVLVQHKRDLPLTRDQRTQLAELVSDFAERVTAYLNGETERSQLVRQYADAVGRAASDRNNRQTRATALTRWINDVFE